MRSDLPSGTVTFLFTDVEGSTRLLHKLGAEGYAQALAEHRRVIRQACAGHDGVEVDTQGDAFFFAFPTAPGALSAAGEMTEALASGQAQVRVGLHTGTPLLTAEGYVGDDVHFAARVAASSHGGQVVLSSATAELVELDLLNLGEHRLKDIEGSVAIFQFGDGSFPPLKTISNTNLPLLASSFVGRERELEEVLSRIGGGARLVTLTGPGGSGKTRLALEAASSLVPEYKAGVFWVGLAALRDSALVTEMISQTLGAKDGLAEHIGERELLLLLDNLEQVIEAAPELPALLTTCPNLTLLVTSRELLRVQGEVEYPVPPLEDEEAVSLFCARSQLEPSDEIAELCVRLDSLPLAVELAAARTKALSPAQILERLSQRLDLLKGGRDADPRQRTLRATIEWSYDLLTPDEQQLFARLSVFSGGCTLEAAEEVADADIDTLQSLVEKSLLRFSNERYWLLETIREYATERLQASPDRDPTWNALGAHLLGMAERLPAAAGESAGQAEAHTLLDAEHGNLRAVVERAIDRNDHDLVLALAVALREFLPARGHAVEADRWLTAVMPEGNATSEAVGAQAVYAASEIARYGGDPDRAEALKRAVVARARAGEDEAVRRCAAALSDLSDMARFRGDRAGSRRYAEEALNYADSLASRTRVVSTLGSLALDEGRLDDAEVLLEEAARGWRGLHEFNYAVAVEALGTLSLRRGEAEAAASRFRDALRAVADLGDVLGIADCLDDLGAVAAVEGRLERAGVLAGAASAARANWGSADASPRSDHEGLSASDLVRGEAMSIESAVEYAMADVD